MEWFRSYHGAPLDAKHVTVAKRSETQPGVSCAVWWALLDFASQQGNRGSVAGFNPEVAANFFGWTQDTVVRVIQAMVSIEMITDDRITTWEKNQTKRDDHSTPRVQAFRERQKDGETEVKRNETPDKSRVEKRRIEKKQLHTCATADAEHACDEQFAEIWTIYPKREGGNSRHDALKAYRARRRTGVEHQAMLEGTQRYAKYCQEKGWVRTAFVKMGAVFFGPAEHYLETWEVGPTPEPRARMNPEDRVSQTIAAISRRGES